ncbi:hypothetical protein OJ996_11160 [Luteolibacter sp. GHJ8]|uniref:Tetratricopeptide repeat protein n=1 Tax=Luteolibacter rhizosphaerae TaxID=2989719 RepID=A0ABT3G2R7_9BACT|nr:hypothetical protein [Luteolibacter rhizosphaerae]MCW1914138.1 hypothetical protein [Luteolibacter rhizosphaerae]
MIRHLLPLAVLCSLLASSCSFTDVKAARSDLRAGSAAEQGGELDLARRYYLTAYRQAVLIDSDGLPASFAGLAYARTSGYAGDHRAADYALRHLLREKGEPPYPADSLTSRDMIVIEYARFLHDQGRHRESIPIYAEAAAAIARSYLADHDPIGFAEFLEEYAAALSHTGKGAEAAKERSRAAQLRRDHPGQTARETRRRYPRQLQPGQRRYHPKSIHSFAKNPSPAFERRRSSPALVTE